MRYIIGLILSVVLAYPASAANVCVFDKEPTVTDALLVLRRAVGIPMDLPCPNCVITTTTTTTSTSTTSTTTTTVSTSVNSRMRFFNSLVCSGELYTARLATSGSSRIYRWDAYSGDYSNYLELVDPVLGPDWALAGGGCDVLVFNGYFDVPSNRSLLTSVVDNDSGTGFVIRFWDEGPRNITRSMSEATLIHQIGS